MTALSNLAQHYLLMHRPSAAVDTADQLLTLAQDSEELSVESLACHVLGDAHRMLGRYAESTRYYEQVDDTLIFFIFRNYQSPKTRVSTHQWHKPTVVLVLCIMTINCGTMLRNVTNTIWVRYYSTFTYRTPAALAHISSDTSGKLSSMIELGRVLLGRRDVHSSIRVLGKALAHAQQMKKTGRQAEIYSLLGDCYVVSGKCMGAV